MSSGIDPLLIGEAVDHLVTAPVSNWTILKGVPLAELYRAARARAGGPLTLAASRLLADRVRPGDVVLVVSGFIMRDYGRPETDGPVGAAVLARTLALGLGARPVGVSEAEAAPALEACFRAAGLIPAGVPELGRGRNRCAAVAFPVDEAEAPVAAKTLLQTLRPAALVAVERPGANRHGRYHGGGGFDISSFTAKTDVLFALARSRGVATVGVGDLGNELGLGVVAEEVRRLVPHGERCGCPCEGGIAAALLADVAVVANISNWGAYGVAACLAAGLGDEDLFHTGADERRLIEACVAAGAIDPVGAQLRSWVDGTDATANAAMVDLLRSVVVLGARPPRDVERYRASWSERRP
jgi:hypothetical protein